MEIEMEISCDGCEEVDVIVEGVVPSVRLAISTLDEYLSMTLDDNKVINELITALKIARDNKTIKGNA